MDQSDNLATLHESISDLSQAQENYEVLFYNNPVAALIFDCDTYNIQQANRAALMLYGYSPEEFLSLRMDQLYVPDSHFDLSQELESLCSGESAESAVAHVRKDGVVIWVEGMWQRLLYETKLSILAWLRRVTPPLRQDPLSAKMISFPEIPAANSIAPGARYKTGSFVRGQTVPQSGIYAAMHKCSSGTQEIVLMEGAKFPSCKICRDLRYRLVKKIPHISEDPDFGP
jgi:PAS domain S-box-containing protein